jgi:hypothetical protein
VVGYGHFTKGEVRAADGNRLLIVKVNPKNVVSVPKYEGHTKMRVCEYTVVSQITDIVKELDKVVYTADAVEISPDYDNSDCGCSDNCGLDNADDYTDDYTDETEGDDSNSEYSIGYKLGSDDILSGKEYQFSLDGNETDEFHDGYSDGYCDNEVTQ